MRIYISIDGVLRNFLQKFEYHYNDYYLNNEPDGEESFKYGIDRPIHTVDNFKFQSKEEMEVFMYLEFPLEIFGHAGLSSSTSMSDINKIVFGNKSHVFTFIGLDEYGKSKPSTLFFLSKNGFLGNNIKFISKDNIKKEWKIVTFGSQIIKILLMNVQLIKFVINLTQNTIIILVIIMK